MDKQQQLLWLVTILVRGALWALAGKFGWDAATQQAKAATIIPAVLAAIGAVVAAWTSLPCS